MNHILKNQISQRNPVYSCYRARLEVQERARKAGIHLLFAYGKLT